MKNLFETSFVLSPVTGRVPLADGYLVIGASQALNVLNAQDPAVISVEVATDGSAFVRKTDTLTLIGDVNGSGSFANGVITQFAPNPVFTGNFSMTIPIGSGAQRPAPVAGMMRINNGS